MEDRFAYGLNLKKLGAVSAHLCDPATAPAEGVSVRAVQIAIKQGLEAMRKNFKNF